MRTIATIFELAATAFGHIMRNTILLLLLTISLGSIGQTNSSFASLKFDKVIMYDYQPFGEDPSLIDKKGQLVETATIKNKFSLTQQL